MSYLETRGCASGQRSVAAAAPHHVRAAVPVLLDGADRGEARSRSCSTSTPTTRSGPGSRRFKHINKLLFEIRTIRAGSGTRCMWRVCRDLPVADCLGASPPMPSSGCRFRWRADGGGADLPGLSGAAVDPVHSRSRQVIVAYGLFDSPLGPDPDLSDDPDPVLHVAPDGLLQVHPLRAGGVRADRRGDTLADPDQASSCRWPCRG